MALERKISLPQATALNMIDMVGIGPFIVMSSVIVSMGGPQCILAWVAGALLAFTDAFVWSELGAAMPEAGGSYAFLRETYGREKWGKLMSFLFIWQTIFQASFVVASGAIGFSKNFEYLYHFDALWQKKLVAGGIVLLVVLALYRKIETLGKLSVAMWVVVIGTMGWIIITGATHFNSSLAFTYPTNAFTFDWNWFKGLGDSMQYTVYAFLGYYNVCHLGSEIQNPQKNIPRSMFISVALITVLYCAMQLSVLGIIPWQETQKDQFIFSILMERVYGHTAAVVVTVLILFIAFTSLFAVVLGYSRIPYAAALDGNFFKVFAKEHPEKKFPHISLLVFGGLSVVLSVVFNDLKPVVAIILTMRIIVQFIGQSIGLILYRKRVGAKNMPYKMWLYPLPIIIAVGVWFWLFTTRSYEAQAFGAGMILLGLCVYFFRSTINSKTISE